MLAFTDLFNRTFWSFVIHMRRNWILNTFTQPFIYCYFRKFSLKWWAYCILHIFFVNSSYLLYALIFIYIATQILLINVTCFRFEASKRVSKRYGFSKESTSLVLLHGLAWSFSIPCSSGSFQIRTFVIHFCYSLFVQKMLTFPNSC